MKIAILAPLISSGATGLSTYVSTLAAHLIDAGWEVTVLATDIGLTETGSSSFPSSVDLRVFAVHTMTDRRLYRCPALVAWLEANINSFDILDVQGMWTSVGAVATQVARSQEVPVVLTPHGMMTAYDWNKHPFIKALAYKAVFRHQWHTASAIRFLSQGEAEQTVKACVQPTTVIPNAVDPPPSVSAIQQLAQRREMGIAEEGRILLFLGRVCHQKGVIEAVEAFSACPNITAEDCFLIAGPVDPAYQQSFELTLANSSRRTQIQVLGPVSGRQKAMILAISNVFITLSRNEGLSFAALEALANGLPLIITPFSNLPEVSASNAGIVVELNSSAAAQAIAEAFTPARNLSMRKAALHLYQTMFSWGTVLPRLLSFYESLKVKK